MGIKLKDKDTLVDERGNTAHISYWGSREEAEERLRSLLNCSDCTDCSGCTGCFDCSDCSGCFDCTDCSDCSGCSDCFRCDDCSEKKLSGAAPVINDIHKRVYEAVSRPHALNMSEWHTCETTHCRAGWVVTLAGDAGRALEERTSTLFAAQQIYRASGYRISPCRFFDSNRAAMADMKRLAEQSNEKAE